jgi:hypothetical protein
LQADKDHRVKLAGHLWLFLTAISKHVGIAAISLFCGVLLHLALRALKPGRIGHRLSFLNLAAHIGREVGGGRRLHGRFQMLLHR